MENFAIFGFSKQTFFISSLHILLSMFTHFIINEFSIHLNFLTL